jgi:hypothetical protein
LAARADRMRLYTTARECQEIRRAFIRTITAEIVKEDALAAAAAISMMPGKQAARDGHQQMIAGGDCDAD